MTKRPTVIPSILGKTAFKKRLRIIQMWILSGHKGQKYKATTNKGILASISTHVMSGVHVMLNVVLENMILRKHACLQQEPFAFCEKIQNI